MNNIALKSLSAENFASFSERVTFTTEVDVSKKEHLINTFEMNDMRFNKVSFLYGANGSGKTYFCKILREIQRFLKFSPITAMSNSELFSMPQFKSLNSPIRPFAFDRKYEDSPTTLAIDIIIDKVTYHYEFSIKGKEVVSELLTKKHRRTEKLIERTSSSYKDIVLRSEFKEFESAKHRVKEEALCLPVAELMNNPLANKIVSAIRDIQVVSMTAAKLAPTQGREAFSDERINKYINVLKKADPTLRDIDVSFEEEEISRQKIDGDDFENREIIATRTTVGISTEHAVFDNGVETTAAPLSFLADESLGTIKLFTALPYLYNVLETGGILIVDELENGLHLSLAREIIRLFIDEESNPNHAQLICTSHQPLLVSGEYRRDQVWVTSKDKFGKSTLHRMSELKTSRAQIKLENRILEGAFGCNPDFFFKDNT